MLFNSNLSRLPVLGQVVNLDLLLCTGFDSMLFCSYVIFVFRGQRLIERLSEAMGSALVGNNFSPIPLKFSFHMKKNVLVAARNLQSIKKTF